MKEIRICDDAEPLKVLAECEKYGMGIEIQGFYNPNEMDDPTIINRILEYKELLKDFKGGKSLHAPFWDLDLGSKNKAIKNITMDTYNYAYRVAKELGCTEIVVHNGFKPNTSFYEGWVKNATIFWQEFFEGKDDSITMMIENQCEEDCEVLKMEIDSVNDSRLKVCLDIGHAHANSNMKVENWISNLGDRIGYLHLHNNHGKVEGRPSFKNDEHHGLDIGTMDMEKVLDLLEKNCPGAIWNIECKLPELQNSLDVLEKYNFIKESSKIL